MDKSSRAHSVRGGTGIGIDIPPPHHLRPRDAFLDQVLFRDTRSWICQQARGEVLEVAIGTGLNLEHYPPDVHITGVELSHNMLAIAQRRAHDLGCQADLRVGDVEALDIPNATLDTVVCTFSLCAIPDYRKALAEMTRVRCPGDCCR